VDQPLLPGPPQEATEILPWAAGHAVAAFGAVRVPLDEVPALRRSVGPPGGPPFPATYLKASEDQTVAAVAAVSRALVNLGLGSQGLSGWGLIAAPRSLGRLAAAEALRRYQHGGALKVSPFVVPHRSLHSVSGTLSQGFNIRGPNFGVGGHPGAVAEGLLAALALLAEQPLPGLWLVLTECCPEPVPDAAGVSVVPVVYHALALAFLPAAVAPALLRLRLEQGPAAPPPAEHPTLASLMEFLDDGEPADWSCPLNWGATLRLTRVASSARVLPRRAA
jgi:hypothetical protein